ncbi:MAG: ATP-dependent DNA ligase [Segniliparus sp.]|uniref:ATP-dependent DNA ligase n=1 Tax=Segniliparus sp. TaxID=2804064 RepID=UPI003F35F758
MALAAPFAPMLAKAAEAAPEQDDPPCWSYEPKWDGFRGVVFWDGESVVIGSRGEKELTRYFPELCDALARALPTPCVLDGEIVVPVLENGRARLDWEALSARIHPAASRIKLLAEATPAHFVAFDLVEEDGTELLDEPFAVRRERLEALFRPTETVHLSSATTDGALAASWLAEFEGAGLDGVVAKRLDGPYRPGKRDMVKVKHARTADCAVVGYRPHQKGVGVGSLMLGLFEDGEFRLVGGAGSFSNQMREELLATLRPLETGEEASGEANRWKKAEQAKYVPVRPELVVEVAYDQMQGRRFRHAVTFLRFRPDREPQSCGFDQLAAPKRYDVRQIWADAPADGPGAS